MLLLIMKDFFFFFKVWEKCKCDYLILSRITKTQCFYCILMFKFGGKLLIVGRKDNSYLEQNSNILKFFMKELETSSKATFLVRSATADPGNLRSVNAEEMPMVRALSQCPSDFCLFGTFFFNFSRC